MAWGVPKLGTLVEDATGNFDLIEPASVAEGDLMVACIAYRGNAAVSLSGWSAVATAQNSGDTDATNGIASGAMFYVVRGSSAPNLTVTRTGGDVVLARVISYSGGHPSAPYDTGSANTLGSASATATTGTFSTAEDGELVVAMVSGGDNYSVSAFDAATNPATASGATDTTTAPTGNTWIERHDSGTGTGADATLAIADGIKSTAGATGTIQATVSGSARQVMIAGAFKLAPPTYTQAEAAFYEDGTESGSTVIDSGADSITRDVSGGDSNIQLRTRLQNSNATAGISTDDYQLQYELNDSGEYASIGSAVADNYSETNLNTGSAAASIASSGLGIFQGAGQSFTGNGNTIVLTKLYLVKVGSPTGNATVKIYAHSGTFGSTGIPTGAALATSDNFDVSTLTTGSLGPSYYVAFSGGNQITLTNGTRYFLTFEYSGGNDSNYIQLGGDLNSPTHAGNFATLASSTWTEDASKDAVFAVYTSPGLISGYNSGSLTDGNATTNRLGAGTGSFVAGKISEDGLVDNHQITASNYTEYLYSLTLVSSALADADTLDFRVLRNGAVITSYAVTPRITIEKSVGDDHTLVSQDSALALTMDNATITQNHVTTAQDIALGLSMDATTITQNHVIQPQDIGLSLTEDNATTAQTHIVTAQDIALSLTEDNTTIATNHILPVQDIAHSLTTDNTTLAQNHVVASSDIALSLTTDNTTVTETHVVAVQDIALALTTDNTTISQNHVVTAQDIALALTTDNTSLTQNHIVASNDVALSLTEDNATVTQTHTVAVNDIALALTEDNTTITQTHILVAQDIQQSLTTDNTSLTQAHIVVVQDIAHALTLDNTTVETAHIVVVQDVALALTTDATTLTQIHSLTVQDIALALTTDNTTLATNHVLPVQDIALALTEDNTTISQNHIVVPQDISLTLTEDNTTITQIHVIASNDITFSLTLDNTTIDTNHVLPVQDITLSLTEDNTTITQNHIVAVQDILLSLTTDNATILTIIYSYAELVSLPANNNDLANVFSTTNYTEVGADDTSYQETTGDGFLVVLFKKQHTNNTDEITLSWNGKSGLAPTASAVYLQIWNETDGAWETLDSDNTTAVNTELSLTGEVTVTPGEYYDGTTVSGRVYQENV